MNSATFMAALLAGGFTRRTPGEGPPFRPATASGSRSGDHRLAHRPEAVGAVFAAGPGADVLEALAVLVGELRHVAILAIEAAFAVEARAGEGPDRGRRALLGSLEQGRHALGQGAVGVLPAQSHHLLVAEMALQRGEDA